MPCHASFTSRFAELNAGPRLGNPPNLARGNVARSMIGMAARPNQRNTSWVTKARRIHRSLRALQSFQQSRSKASSRTHDLGFHCELTEFPLEVINKRRQNPVKQLIRLYLSAHALSRFVPATP
ncbi:hypothetical protein EYR36_002981 [Pleurotus pulmonarius]|nr:hypothetical protein EYR36_002981 [Pleurotus pulmonarius]